MNNFPLNQGERPAFKALPLIETMYADIMRCGNAYESISPSEIYDSIAQLFVFAEIIKIRAHKGRDKMRDDLKPILFELPLFFSAEYVKNWEGEKPWSSPLFCDYPHYINAYSEDIDSPSPSMAYQANSDHTKYMWANWLKHSSAQEIINVLLFSAQVLFNWEAKRPTKSALQKNIDFLADVLKVNSSAWFLLTAAGSSKTKLWDIYMKEVSPSVEKLMLLWERAFFLPKESIVSLVSYNSPLIEKGIFNQMDESTNWSEIWEKIKPEFNEFLSVAVNTPNDMMKFFADDFKYPVVPLESFKYLDNFKVLKTAIQNPLKILIYGEAKTGKKTFLSSLLKESGLVAWKIKELESIKHLNVVSQITSCFKKDILLFDVPTLDGVLKDFIKSPTPIAQVWMVEDITKLHEDMLEDFDVVLETKPMPIEERLEYTKTIFSDNETVLRVARTVRSPHDIIKLKKWCELTGHYSWTNVSEYLVKFSILNQKISSDDFALKKVEIETKIPKLAGYKELEDLLENVIHIFNNTQQYQKLDAKPPKGILLLGPPGTGKTYFAKNLSQKINIPMYSADTSSLAKDTNLIEKVFAQARRCAPCILFLDEIDTLITDPKEFLGVNLEKQKITNSFLAQLDGVNLFEGVLIIGATHRGDQLDEAATRAGRLSEIVTLSLPEKKSRIAIWESHLKFKPVGDISVDTLAQISAGFSGAEIAEVINKAAVHAARKSQSVIEMVDMVKACDNVFWGTNDYSTQPNIKELKSTAYHEAGHALIAIKNNLTVQRITIRPKQGFLGAVHSTPQEGVYTMDLATVKGRVQMLLAGIASEKIKFNQYGNGGGSDLKKCKETIHTAILTCGLGDIGPMSASKSDLWSNEFKLKIEHEEKEIMDNCFTQVSSWLEKHIDLLDELAQMLLDKRELGMEDLEDFKSKVYSVTDVNIEKLLSVEDVLLKSPKEDL